MAIEDFDGGTIFTGDDIHKFRIISLKGRMSLELKGIKFRGGSTIAHVKKEFGLTGSRQSVFEQFCKMHGLEAK